MSKPTIVVLPVVLLLFDWWPLRRKEGCRRLALEKAPLFAMSAGVGLLTVMGQNRSGALSLLNAALRLRIENAIVNTMTYLQKMLWPVNLTAFYPKQPPLAIVVLSASFL